MSLQNILILIASALLIRILFPGKNRQWALLVLSTLAIFWLQPPLSIRNLDFWFPTATIGLVFLSWGIMSTKEQLRDPGNLFAAGLSLGTISLIGMTRFINLKGILTPSRPPLFFLIAAAVIIIILLTIIILRFVKPTPWSLWLSVIVLLAIFILLKTPTLANQIGTSLRKLMSQDPTLTSSSDLNWLGFSYVAFRLIHTLIDRLNGRLDGIKLGEYLVYTLFYPAILAGPIDRLQRFREDLANPKPISSPEVRHGGIRLAVGLLRKFILADLLGLIAISGSNSHRVQSTGWLWVMLIAYSFQIYLDFAGYTDIAIGSGILLGFKLPENFNHPYIKPNLTLFWNNWHMSLTHWIRTYFFFPVTRKLRRKRKLPAPLIILITQVSTMLLIGLWHGITLNFLIWGLWHGIGLFIHNRWSAKMGSKMGAISSGQPFLAFLIKAVGVCLTFLFVSLGWIWFALPSPDSALRAFRVLFGL